jgi:transcriptional regulator with XRE-family HTH domain
MRDLDIEQLSRELVRHLRGRRSQLAFSRHLGFGSNACQSWELGKRYPQASVFLNMAQRSKLPIVDAIARFLQQPSEWLRVRDASAPQAVTALLLDLRGDRRISELAAAADANRATLSRWLQGNGEPRLPDLLQLVQAATHRLLEFVGLFAAPGELPSTRPAWEDLERQRRLAFDLPMSHAVLRALELTSYQRLARHQEGFIAGLLGISLDDERHYLAELARAGQIHKQRGAWRIKRVLTIDTRSDPDENRRLKQYWTQLGAERIGRSDPGLFCYNVFSVSEADYRRLSEMHLAYFEELRAIVGKSAPPERVVVANLQMFALDGGAPAAGARPAARRRR